MWGVYIVYVWYVCGVCVYVCVYVYMVCVWCGRMYVCGVYGVGVVYVCICIDTQTDML